MWRLMTHNEMQDSYKNNMTNFDHAYLTNFPVTSSDPLYSIDIYDGPNEDYNTKLALMIIDVFNKAS